MFGEYDPNDRISTLAQLENELIWAIDAAIAKTIEQAAVDMANKSSDELIERVLSALRYHIQVAPAKADVIKAARTKANDRRWNNSRRV